jgi:hypothetical protein
MSLSDEQIEEIDNGWPFDVDFYLKLPEPNASGTQNPRRHSTC